jgi:hypothetical protein
MSYLETNETKGWFMNEHLERMWEEEVMTYFTILEHEWSKENEPQVVC